MTGERPGLPARTLATRLVAVVRARSAEAYDPLLEALCSGGVASVELTLTTPGTLAALPGLRGRYGEVADLGVGTVTETEQARAAVEAGAAYLVTPVVAPEVVDLGTAAGVPVLPGGLTPTELHAGWSRGAAAVKVFPAGTVGPGYLKDLAGPFPDLRAVPSGGVDLDGAEQWLRAGAVAVSVGGPLLGDATRGGDLVALRDRARAFVDRCGAA